MTTVFRAGVVVLVALCVGGCSTTTTRGDKAFPIALRERPPARISIAPGQAGQRVVCLAGHTGWQAHANPRDVANSDALLLAGGLGDLCHAYRDGRLTQQEYAAALQDYAALLVELVGYRLVSRLAPDDRASTGEVEALIAGNQALRALCKAPQFQDRLVLAEAATGVPALARWCVGEGAHDAAIAAAGAVAQITPEDGIDAPSRALRFAREERVLP